MGNAAWGAGYHTGVGEGLAIGEAAGVKKGVAIGVAASAAVVATVGVGLWKLAPGRLVSKHPLGREQDPAAMDSTPVAEKGVEDEQEAREGIPSE
ncbi:hypothetical protein [Actinomadura sp. 6K520]|uniref:hypothetical protein n=1 Tax=Actinomadura sp. 6K520 TaxID=2530364 RepID=UPI001044A38C|nr:hypothetical protein [Actinomadura sp. 6K520]TDE33644.1 hypothetical protein E1289_11645 [Actinomadura sp. 6K520]